jgi:hypothetical protein
MLKVVASGQVLQTPVREQAEAGEGMRADGGEAEGAGRGEAGGGGGINRVEAGGAVGSQEPRRRWWWSRGGAGGREAGAEAGANEGEASESESLIKNSPRSGKNRSHIYYKPNGPAKGGPNSSHHINFLV